MQKKHANILQKPPGPTWVELLNLTYKNQDDSNLTFPSKLSQKYGELTYISSLNAYLLSGATVFEHVLKLNAKNYVRHPLIYNRLKLFFGNSLLVNSSEPWKYRRKIALPAYKYENLQRYFPLITSLTAEYCTYWQSKNPSEVNLLKILNYLTLDITFYLFCQKSATAKMLQSLEPAIAFCNQYCSKIQFLHPLIPTWSNLKFQYYNRQVDRLLLKVIQERREVEEPAIPDLLSLLLNAENQEKNGPLTTKEILAEFKTHMITGHETTACTLAWMWHLLAQHPEYREALEAELAEVLGGRLPTEADIPALKMTKAIISETLRLYPAIWSITRTNLEADVINGYDIPKGSQLWLHIYSLHRNPLYWENPHQFYPERFLETHPKHPHFAFLPFSAGPQTCIASNLAMFEAILVTATIAQQIRFEHSDKKKVIPEPCISLRLLDGLKMRPKWINK
jgi:cytochrome P450